MREEDQLRQTLSQGGLAMISDKERQIQESFTNIEYRKALAIEHVNTTLAVQIRKMREHRQWKQHEFGGSLRQTSRDRVAMGKSRLWSI